jgi:diguanylate cyclase (GGDEF)-like protein/PAS domain S-box-containing protein
MFGRSQTLADDPVHRTGFAFSLRILVLEDTATDAELMLHAFRQAGWKPEWHWVHTKQAFIEELDSLPDIILADYAVPGFGAPQALELLRARRSHIPLIVVTGSLTDEAAVECMKLGAADYLLKDRLARLPESVSRAMEEARRRAEQEQANQALRESERLKDAIIRSSLDCVITIDAEERILEFNPAAEGTFGYKREDAVGRAMPDLIIPAALREAHHRGFARLLATGEGPILGKRLELSALRSDGTEFPIELTISATGSWQAPLFTAVIRDISARRAAENKIRRLNRVYAVLSAINGLIVRVRDREVLYKEACRIAVDEGEFGIAMLGLFDEQTLDVKAVGWAGNDAVLVASLNSSADPAHQFGKGTIGRSIRESQPVFSNDMTTDPGSGSKRHAAIRRGYRSVVSLPLMNDGVVLGVFMLMAKEKDFFNEDEMKLLAELAADISFALKHIASLERLDYLAYYDPLTDLPNRTFFFDRMSQELSTARESGRNLALVVGDLRRLRVINESFGRETGDALLRDIARRFKQSWPHEGLVGRIAADCVGGVIIDLKDATDAARLVEGPINSAITAPFQIKGQELRFSMSFGIAVFPTDGHDAETLVKNADAALNRAKKEGEHYLFYRPQMNAKVTENLLLGNKLRRALEKEEFVLHYQPKVDAQTNEVTGVEALIRWLDPDVGLIPPAQFIPLLEDTGMILEVGRWAIRQALRDYRDWQAQFTNAPRVAVNVSTIQLKQADFVEVIRAAISESGISGPCLDLEITESMFMEDIEENIAKLSAVQDMGVSVAIDDFGTGYSSLGYLAKLPVNALKIDRSFISTMADRPDSMTIVSTVISLAHALNLKVVAEGVESETQSRLLKLLSCDEIQGYHVGKPMPADQFVTFVRTNAKSDAYTASLLSPPLAKRHHSLGNDA